MAAYNSGVFFGLLVIASASSMANCLIPLSVLHVRVGGILHCSLPPVPSGSPTLSGVNVFLSCDQGTTSLAQGVTDVNGKFNIVYNLLEGVRLDQLECAVYVRTPILDCNVFTGPFIKAALVNVDLVGLLTANILCGEFLNIL